LTGLAQLEAESSIPYKACGAWEGFASHNDACTVGDLPARRGLLLMCAIAIPPSA